MVRMLYVHVGARSVNWVIPQKLKPTLKVRFPLTLYMNGSIVSCPCRNSCVLADKHWPTEARRSIRR